MVFIFRYSIFGNNGSYIFCMRFAPNDNMATKDIIFWAIAATIVAGAFVGIVANEATMDNGVAFNEPLKTTKLAETAVAASSMGDDVDQATFMDSDEIETCEGVDMSLSEGSSDTLLDDTEDIMTIGLPTDVILGSAF